MDVREKLVEQLRELSALAPLEQFQELLREASDYIANGVTVQRERELVCVTKTGPSEAVYFRKIYFCPSCDTEIGYELLDVNTERVFGHGTVMKNNKFPKCCPECGTRIVVPTPPKGE